MERDTPLGFDQKPWGLNPTKSGILRSGNEDFKAHAVLKQPTWFYIYIDVYIRNQRWREPRRQMISEQFPATSVATKPNNFAGLYWGEPPLREP